ncbi:TonB-dependent receptor domain-containing protein [Asticcacaulis solisilvae]|uniref:TonB-dependent receptor domain-containing protein n=1 Tax=Asticcacaulis solisilvae TaxID=1217274 RepID=UPI003FD7DDB1
MPTRLRKALSFAVSLVVVALSGGIPALAHAADPAYPIDIPAGPLPGALVTLATQTGLSIGGVDPARCEGRAAAVKGRMKAEQALRLLLNGSRCDIRRFNANTFRLDLKPEPKAVTPVARKQAPAPALAPVEDVVITRRPVALTRIPRSVSVVSSRVLDGDDLDLPQLASRVAGMAVTNLGPGRDKILLRGVSDSVLTGRTQSTVGLYLDDSALTYNAPDPDLLLVDMARVEVLKGPQGALYGQGSMAGVVRLVSNKPLIDRFEADLGAGVGATAGGNMSWRGTAMINLPVFDRRAGLRAVLYQDQTGGFINEDVAGHHATNTTNRFGGRLSFAWPVSPDLTVTASAIAQRLNSENSQYVFSKRPPYHRETALAEPHDNGFEDMSAGVEGNWGRNTFKLSLNHLHHRLSTGYDAQPVQRYVSIPNSGVLFYEEDQSISLSTAEFSVLSPTEGRLRWLGGVFLARSAEKFRPNLSDVFDHNTLYSEMRRDDVNDAALFGGLSYDLTKDWTIAASLRATQTRHDTDSRISNVHLIGYAASGTIDGDIYGHHLAHSLSASYHPRPGVLIYVQAADGFRTGGFNTTTQVMTPIPQVYRGDALDCYELGVKFNTPDNRWRLNLTTYQVEWRGIQSDQLRATGLPIVVNIGDGNNTGAEAELDWTVTPDVLLHLAAQVNNPQLTKPNPQFSKDEGGGMPYIARTSASLSADWYQAVLGYRLENSATLSYRGPSPLNYGPLRDVRMDPYTNLDLSSTLPLGATRIGVRVTNATGVHSNSFAYGNPFSVDGSSQITPLRPRTVWLSVSQHF